MKKGLSKLGEFFDIKHGYAFKGEYFSDEGSYVLMTPGNFYEKGGFKSRGDKEKYYIGDIPESYILNQDDLIVVMTEQMEGLLGSPAIVPANDKYLHNQRLGLIVDLNEENLCKKYLYYLFNTRLVRHQISASATGTKVRHTSPKRILSVEVNLPEIGIQRKMASILSTYDDLIENNIRRIDILEQAAQELYKEWFVRLKFPGLEHTRSIDGVPDGWQKVTLGEICYLRNERVDPLVVEQNTPYVGLEHIPRESITLNNWGTSEDVTSTKLRFEKYDILFGKIRPYFHKVVFAPMDGICSSDTLVINTEDPDLYMYILATVSSIQFVKYTSTTVKEGSKMPRADWDMMTKYHLHLPPKPLLLGFNAFMQPIVEQLENLMFQNRKLQQARDLLLPKLMTGEIVV